MSRYFSYFPQTYYSLNDGASIEVVTDLMKRIKFDENLKTNSEIFYTYDIEDGERPDTLANKIYGDSEKHWIILLMNNIVDVKSEWPLSYSEMVKLIEQKYGDVATAKATVHGYFKTETFIMEYVQTDRRVETTQINQTEYTSLTEGTTLYVLGDGSEYNVTIEKTIKSKYDYEMELNEQKRTIQLLKPAYVSSVMREFQTILNG
jgi:hypothetical protein